jgi:PLP dependent protein
MCEKREQLPADISWHMIGHLQSNKVKYIAPFVSQIHSVDSFKLLEEINKQAQKNNRIIPCFLQMYIATEDSKFGLNQAEALAVLQNHKLNTMQNIVINGLMGMASNTTDNQQVSKEFALLKTIFESFKSQTFGTNVVLTELSMGMSGDYPLALAQGSTMVRVGSALFGNR